jgi:hypothetical protein
MQHSSTDVTFSLSVFATQNPDNCARDAPTDTGHRLAAGGYGSSAILGYCLSTTMLDDPAMPTV